MASRADPAAGHAAMHACPQCSKKFSRLCDLNKHSKSHTRPYKCNDSSCKYHTLGWPTAKELERHYNDKHSTTPRTFPCSFPPCTYWSKRESNCKQHMEKAHGWKYVKSKSKDKRHAAREKPADSDPGPGDCGMASKMDHGTSVPSSSPPSIVTSGMDFVLFDNNQADAFGDDDNHLYPGYGDAPDSQSYLPWSSPTTRLRKNEQIIETFSQTYEGLQEKPSMARGTIDTEGDSISSNFALYDIRHHQQVDCHDQNLGETAIKVESPAITVDDVSPAKRKYELVDAHPTDAALTFSTPSVGQQHDRRGRACRGPLIRSCAGSKYGDGGGEGGCQPRKRPKLNPVESFTDTSMPDIFRYAHPDIYDRSRTEKYAPCHTAHREISTLVPAHRLKVTERAISSFDILDPAFRHPRVGVCRSCWETFRDRLAFDHHVSRPCQKVSKGKQEKWRVLFNSFTPLHGSTVPDVSSDSGQQIDEQLQVFSGHLDCSPACNRSVSSDEAGTPPTSVPSAAVLQIAGSASPGTKNVQSISAYEHEKLQREHQALRERHQQLERMTQALLIQRLIQESTNHTAVPGSDVKPPVPSSSKNNRLRSSPPTSDRDSLVQHMNSLSTDVDVYGFMQEMEDTRQTLSRINSGLSTASRSTIHHVPPSPPSQPAELSGLKGGGFENHQAKHSPSHRAPLPSIPDSGYGTEQRRGSLGDLPVGAGQSAPAKPPIPPSTAEAAEGVRKAHTMMTPLTIYFIKTTCNTRALRRTGFRLSFPRT
ncbi:hypothetical protein N657DRAFT_427506 [Parathielavia appendiculata]|uniref:C2H2-type domain-containing protein n=1 Tax=Parathielavia appendiculata TaxID=2587402 RepID=A0AAN6TZT3_9PEZI|nr:hypothetical protein N657DRAFT_427506 [Parathielavia appendiculata]